MSMLCHLQAKFSRLDLSSSESSLMCNLGVYLGAMQCCGDRSAEPDTLCSLVSGM